MAIVTKRIGGDGDADRGYITFEVDYDDVKLNLVTIRCKNESSEAAWGMASMVSNGRSYDMRFPANKLTEISVPDNKRLTLEITITPNGRIDGVEYYFMWPYP